VDMPAIAHRIALLLALNVMRKKPQLSCADEIIGYFCPGNGSCCFNDLLI
jgi:hypothetical protein